MSPPRSRPGAPIQQYGWLGILGRVRRAVLLRRRLLAALLAALGAIALLHATTGAPPPLVPVLVAARDLPAGATLENDDMHQAGFAPGSAPTGTLDVEQAVGRSLTIPLRRGEAITDSRLVSSSLLSGYPGTVAVPIQLGDAASRELLQVGDRVDLLASDANAFTDESGETRLARTVAKNAYVVAIPEAREVLAGPDRAGALVLVAVQAGESAAVAYASAASYVSVLLK